MGNPKLSIILLAYNAEAYISEAITSLLGQTLSDIEVIAVDDGSSDATASLLAEFANQDARIVIVTHDENRGCLAAHVSGIAVAKGEYCTFIASDDSLAFDACEVCWEALTKTNVDILQFGFEPFADEGELEEEDRASILAFSQPRFGDILLGADIGRFCFVEGSISWNVAGKIIKTTVCQKACLHIRKMYLNFAEDCYLFYFVCLEAHSYMGLPNTNFYRYRIGSGISQNKLHDVAVYARICDCVRAFDAIEGYFGDFGGTTVDAFCWYKHARMRVLRDIVDRLLGYMKAGRGSQAFEILLEHWPCEEVAAYFKTSAWIPVIDLSFVLGESSLFSGTANMSRIALFHEAESALCDTDAVKNFLMNTEFKLVFDFENNSNTGEEKTGNAAPEDTFVRQLDVTREMFSNVINRLRENEIDTVVWFSGGEPLTLGDVVALRCSGVQLVVVFLEESWLPLDWDRCTFLDARLNLPFVASLANAVVCPNGLASFWGYFNDCVRGFDTAITNDAVDALLRITSCVKERTFEIREREMWKNFANSFGELYSSQTLCWSSELEKSQKYCQAIEKRLSDEAQALRRENAELIRSMNELEDSYSFKLSKALLFVPAKVKKIITG